MATQLWQLYDPQGRPIVGQGARKHEAAVKGLLHASAHLWLWRRNHRSIEVLVQKRTEYKVNWPGRLDKSAGGHVILGEEPLTTAVRKAQEELGMAIDPNNIKLVGVSYWREPIGDTGLVDHEFQWVFINEFDGRDFTLDFNDVESVEWKSLATLKRELANPQQQQTYVPYGYAYFTMLERVCAQKLARHTEK